MASRSINFSEATNFGRLIIDTTNTLPAERELLNQLYKSLWDDDYLNAEKHILDLLKIDNDNAKYNYLCADCYLWLHQEHGNKSLYTLDKVEYYYIKSLKIETNDVECLWAYTHFLSLYNYSDADHHSKMISLHEHTFSVFETKRYIYDSGCTDIDFLELQFQKQWIMDFALSHGFYNTHDAISDFLIKLRPIFQRLFSVNEISRSIYSYEVVQSYINGYSRIGNYSLIVQLLHQHNQKCNYLLKSNQHVCEYLWLYLEMKMFDKLKRKIHMIASFKYKPQERTVRFDKKQRLIIQPIVDEYHWLNNKIVCQGYLCLMYASKEQIMSEELMHTVILRCNELRQQYQDYLNQDEKKQLEFAEKYHIIDFPLSIQFMNLSLVYLCITKNLKSTYVAQLLKSSRIYYEQLSFEFCSIGHYVISLMHFLYVSGLIANNRDINYLKQDPNIYFAKCLTLTKECIHLGTVCEEKVLLISEPIWIHPIIPLSYYQLGLNAYKSHKFQIAFRFIKKAMEMTQHLDVITNTSELLKKCLIGWMQSSCGYCKRTYSDMNRKNKCCKGCGLVFYCSKQCNKLNWKNKHKYDCDKKWLLRVDHLKTIW